MDTLEATLAAMNRAADDILDRLDAPDTGVRDAINLLVNATAHYIDHPFATLDEAIISKYCTDPEEVLAWAREV